MNDQVPSSNGREGPSGSTQGHTFLQQKKRERINTKAMDTTPRGFN